MRRTSVIEPWDMLTVLRYGRGGRTKEMSLGWFEGMRKARE